MISIITAPLSPVLDEMCKRVWTPLLAHGQLTSLAKVSFSPLVDVTCKYPLNLGWALRSPSSTWAGILPGLILSRSCAGSNRCYKSEESSIKPCQKNIHRSPPRLLALKLSLCFRPCPLSLEWRRVDVWTGNEWLHFYHLDLWFLLVHSGVQDWRTSASFLCSWRSMLFILW